MRTTFTRRRSRRPINREVATIKKDSHQESLFFGTSAQQSFFQPATVSADGAAIQRKCAGCEKEEKVQRSTDKREEEKVQKKEATHTTHSTHTANNYISNISGKGQPMGKSEQSFFEHRIGGNFSQIRIHTDSEAASSAKDINAQAYAYRNHIVFGEGQYKPDTKEGKHLLAHELTHVRQQSGETIQRQEIPAPTMPGPAGPAPFAPEPAAPHFRDCTQAITGRDDADVVLNRAMLLARGYVNTAIDMLSHEPIPGSEYETALALHFGNPLTAGARRHIRRIYQRILRNLTVANFICNRGACNRGDQAFWDAPDDLLHICPPFWPLSRSCQAIVIIHEAAHDSGLDTVDLASTPGDDHTPYRGDRDYPGAGATRRQRVSRSARANTPDAYAFFAAHVHNNADTGTNCF